MELPNKQAVNRTGISVFIILQKCMKWHLDKRGGAGSYEESAEGGKGHLFIGKQKPASFEVLMATVKINPVAWNGFFTQKGKARQMDGSWRSELCSDPNFGLQNDLLHEWRRVWRLSRKKTRWLLSVTYDLFITSQANGDSFRVFLK